MKYIVLQATSGRSLKMELPFVFGNNLAHKIVARHAAKALREHGYHSVKAVSAGEFNPMDGGCTGGSETLKLKSRGVKDVNLIGNHDYTGGML